MDAEGLGGSIISIVVRRRLPGRRTTGLYSRSRSPENRAAGIISGHETGSGRLGTGAGGRYPVVGQGAAARRNIDNEIVMTSTQITQRDLAGNSSCRIYGIVAFDGSFPGWMEEIPGGGIAARKDIRQRELEDSPSIITANQTAGHS